MAKKENSASSKEWLRIEIKDPRGQFLKDLPELKKVVPFDNKKEMERGDRLVKLSMEKSDNGNPLLILEMPARYIETLEAIACGEKKPNLRLEPAKRDPTKRALLGEFEPLIRRLESGAKLTDKERHTLAKIARGTLPRIGRPPEAETEIRNINIVRFAKILKAYGGKRVDDIAAKKFDVDRSYISKLEKKYPHAATMDYLLGSLVTLFGASPQVAWKVRLEAAGVNEGDLREATGRKQVRK
jgi:hypothetical protein